MKFEISSLKLMELEKKMHPEWYSPDSERKNPWYVLTYK